MVDLVNRQKHTTEIIFSFYYCQYITKNQRLYIIRIKLFYNNKTPTYAIYVLPHTIYKWVRRRKTLFRSHDISYKQ